MLTGLESEQGRNKTDTTTMVRTVANPRPNAIVTAIDTKNASGNSGAMPSIVVAAAIATGRNRLTADPMTAAIAG